MAFIDYVGWNVGVEMVDVVVFNSVGEGAQQGYGGGVRAGYGQRCAREWQRAHTALCGGRWSRRQEWPRVESRIRQATQSPAAPHPAQHAA